MTKDEGIKKLIQYCNNEIKNSGWWLFNKKKLQFEETRFFEQYEKVANLPLPENLIINDVSINAGGIQIAQTLYLWFDIVATGIKSEAIMLGDDSYRYDRYLLFCLNKGKIIDTALGNIDHLHGQLGHFIEQYKRENKQILAEI